MVADFFALHQRGHCIIRTVGHVILIILIIILIITTTTIIRLLFAHDALILFSASFSAPKLQHTLRASPCSGHPKLAKFADSQDVCGRHTQHGPDGHAVDPGEPSCQKGRFWDQTCVIACTFSLPGFSYGHTRSPDQDSAVMQRSGRLSTRGGTGVLVGEIHQDGCHAVGR